MIGLHTRGSIVGFADDVAVIVVKKLYRWWRNATNRVIRLKQGVTG